MWISAVSGRLDQLCGPVVVRSVTDFRDGGDYTIYLNPIYLPVSSVTSVTEYQSGTAVTLTANTNTTAVADGYLLRTETGELTRRNGFYDQVFYPGRQNIRIVWSAGRYATTATVGTQFKQAALICISHLWQAENGTRNTTFGGPEDGSFGPGWAIPKRALDILGTEVRPQIGIA
jgi:hypothetical protein